MEDDKSEKDTGRIGSTYEYSVAVLFNNSLTLIYRANMVYQLVNEQNTSAVPLPLIAVLSSPYFCLRTYVWLIVRKVLLRVAPWKMLVRRSVKSVFDFELAQHTLCSVSTLLRR